MMHDNHIQEDKLYLTLENILNNTNFVIDGDNNSE